MAARKTSVAGRVRELLSASPGLSNAQLHQLLLPDFPADNPEWLRNRIGKARADIKRASKKGLRSGPQII